MVQLMPNEPAVALATCSALPDLDPDDQLLLEALRSAGVDARPATWDDKTVNWAAFDLVIVRNTWDYPLRRDEFLDWTRRVPNLANPADVIAWNTDKRYLAELAAAGVPVVHTSWLAPGDAIVLPPRGRHVLKPAVGAGSLDAAAFTLHDEDEAMLAREHVSRLLAAGQTVMLQPYLELIEERGETGLMYFGGTFSHAVTKGAMLADERGLEAGGLYKSETIAPAQATHAQLELGERALAAIPGGTDQLLYARVDLVPDANGDPVVIELELTEPSLFLGYGPGSAERFAALISERLSRTN